MVKLRSEQSRRKVDEQSAEALANELADKPYDKPGRLSGPEVIERLTIALPVDLYDELETLAKKRKRSKAEHRSMSAIAREAIKEYLGKHKT